MKRLTILGSAIVIAGSWQLASAQPPGGGGGFTPPTFDSINMADDEGKKDDHLTLDEVRAYFAERFAAFGGRGPGGGGGPPGGGGGAGPGGGGAGGPGGGDFVANMFAQWDADDDGMVTQKEFDERPQGRGGRRGGGGPPPQ